MSSFDWGVQFLDADWMTYWGKRRDANFRIENASVEWNEEEAPFHTIARLTLLPKSHLQPDAAEATYIDVTGNSTPDSTPLGSINRARQPAESCQQRSTPVRPTVEGDNPRIRTRAEVSMGVKTRMNRTKWLEATVRTAEAGELERVVECRNTHLA